MQHFERLNFVFSLGSGVEEMKKGLKHPPGANRQAVGDCSSA
jgi:hypothetical protein